MLEFMRCGREGTALPWRLATGPSGQHLQGKAPSGSGPCLGECLLAPPTLRLLGGAPAVLEGIKRLQSELGQLPRGRERP